jgi:hypothetical protein
MGEIKVIHDPKGQTLTVWFDNPAKESVCEETTEEVVLIKDVGGKVIGFELLRYHPTAEMQSVVVETVVRSSEQESGSGTVGESAQTSPATIVRGARLNWRAVRDQYDIRARVSERLSRLLSQRNSAEFAEVAMGITDPNGNYSARRPIWVTSRSRCPRFIQR